MIRFKKVSSMLLSSIFTLGLITGCGAKAENSGSANIQPSQNTAVKNSDSKTTEQIKINYYGRPDDNGVESTIVKNFEAENPNIKVNYVELPDSSNDRLKTINTVLQAGDSSIDVFAGDVVWPPIFVSAGWVIPIDEYLEKGALDQYLPGPLSAFQIGGKTYGLPFMADSGALYFRKDLLEKYNMSVPTTWQELIKTGGDILSKENNTDLSGFVSYWMQNESLTCAALEIYWANGGDIVGQDGKSVIDAEKLAAALSQMYNMMTSDKIAASGIETFGTKESRMVVSEGNAVFSRDWLSGYSPYNNPELSKVAGNMEITSLPTNGTLGGWGVMVSNYSKNKEAAITFAKFRANYESQVLANEIVSIVPTIKSIYEDAAVLEKMPHLPKFLPVLDKARPRPQTPYYAELSGIMQLEIHSVISGLTSPEEGAANIIQKVKALLG